MNKLPPQDANISDTQLFKIVGTALLFGILGFMIMSFFPYKGPIKMLPATMAFVVFAILIYRQPKK